jgi:hypothetical protein
MNADFQDCIKRKKSLALIYANLSLERKKSFIISKEKKPSAFGRGLFYRSTTGR